MLECGSFLPKTQGFDLIVQACQLFAATIESVKLISMKCVNIRLQMNVKKSLCWHVYVIYVCVEPEFGRTFSILALVSYCALQSSISFSQCASI